MIENTFHRKRPELFIEFNPSYILMQIDEKSKGMQVDQTAWLLAPIKRNFFSKFMLQINRKWKWVLLKGGKWLIILFIPYQPK